MVETIIRVGDYEVVLAGGMESMSNAPYLLQGARWGMRMGDGAAVDAMIHDGLLGAFEHVNMFQFGSDIAEEKGVTRGEQDEWTLRSHQRAGEATDEGRLAEEIVGVKVPPGKKGESSYVETDEAFRRDTSLESYSFLRWFSPSSDHP
jgi:acetyl-CoA C-acetyltransferase